MKSFCPILVCCGLVLLMLKLAPPLLAQEPDQVPGALPHFDLFADQQGARTEPSTPPIGALPMLDLFREPVVPVSTAPKQFASKITPLAVKRRLTIYVSADVRTCGPCLALVNDATAGQFAEFDIVIGTLRPDDPRRSQAKPIISWVDSCGGARELTEYGGPDWLKTKIRVTDQFAEMNRRDSP